VRVYLRKKKKAIKEIKKKEKKGIVKNRRK